MKIGIMQPYFFPYIGYFQLINYVDKYINLDHVSFMKRSYMCRNEIKNGTRINIPVIKGSQNKSCKDTFIKIDDVYIEKFLKTLKYTYSKDKNYYVVIDNIFTPLIDIKGSDQPMSISEYNLMFIKKICNYLDIDTEIIITSEGITNNKKNIGLQDITKYLGGDHYINAIGGQKLYKKEDFLSKGIKLSFIKINDKTIFKNPYSSIIDILFIYDKELIKNELKNYTLI